jgi:hypothetical protein
MRNLGDVGYQIEIEAFSQATEYGDVVDTFYTDGVTGLQWEIDATATGGVRILVGGTNGGTKTIGADGKVQGQNSTTSMIHMDGAGNSLIVDYDASGNKIGDLWVHNDGTHGVDIYDASGASVGLWTDMFGHAHTTSNDGHGLGLTNTIAPLPVTTNHSAPAAITLGPAPMLGSGIPAGSGAGWTYLSAAHTDAQGAAYTVNFSWAGSVTLNRDVNWSFNGTSYVTDVNGHTKVTSSSVVDTDPGYRSVVTSAGISRGWNYDMDGTPRSSYVDDGAGTRTTYNYDASGRETSHAVTRTDTSGTATTTRFDASGNILGSSVQTTDASGAVITTLNDAAGQVQGSTRLLSDGKGNSVTYTLDTNGCAHRVENQRRDRCQRRRHHGIRCRRQGQERLCHACGCRRQYRDKQLRWQWELARLRGCEARCQR